MNRETTYWRRYETAWVEKIEKLKKIINDQLIKEKRIRHHYKKQEKFDTAEGEF